VKKKEARTIPRDAKEREKMILKTERDEETRAGRERRGRERKRERERERERERRREGER